MKLTKEDKSLLKKWGHPEEDILQIEKAVKISRYIYSCKDKEISISQEEAIKSLGRELFLSGISRSAFHWSALRVNNNVKVYFDSSRLFR